MACRRLRCQPHQAHLRATAVRWAAASPEQPATRRHTGEEPVILSSWSSYDAAPTGSENGQCEDAVHGLGRLVAGEFDAVVGALVGRAPGEVEVFQALRVAGERANVFAGGEPSANHRKRYVQPDGHAVVLQQLKILLLGEAAAAQRHDHGPAGTHCLDAFLNRSRLYFSKLRLPAL